MTGDPTIKPGSGALQPKAEPAPGHPWVIAHRGARTEAPENTAVAFRRAMTYPIDGVELDVQMSADGKAVLHHDRTLKKVAGLRRRVADLTWDELRQLDAGSWFDPAFAGEPLLSFDEMLTWLAGRIRLFIEIKAFRADHRSGRAARLTDSVLKTLSDPKVARHRDSFRVLSFDPDVLRRAGERAPDLRLVLDVSKRDAKRLKQTPDGLLASLSAFCVHVGGVSQPLVDWAHGLGKGVFAYTCNDPATLKKLSAAGIDGILTDDPAWLVGEAGRQQGPGP